MYFLYIKLLSIVWANKTITAAKDEVRKLILLYFSLVVNWWCIWVWFGKSTWITSPDTFSWITKSSIPVPYEAKETAGSHLRFSPEFQFILSGPAACVEDNNLHGFSFISSTQIHFWVQRVHFQITKKNHNNFYLRTCGFIKSCAEIKWLSLLYKYLQK